MNFKELDGKIYHVETLDLIKKDIVKFIEDAEYHPLTNNETAIQLQQLKRWVEWTYFDRFKD